MSAVHAHEQAAPVVDPIATHPTIAAEPTPDTVKPIAAESSTSPEGATALDPAASAPTADKAATETEAEKPVSKDEAVVESQPINEGVLQYKAPGLVKHLISSKRYFWFSEEPVDPKHFSEYLSSGKPDAATVHHNVAHASQTGKGLLFYAKRAEDKDHPVGVFNLSEATDVTKLDLNDFYFKINGQKHTFSAPTKAERDGWLVALEARSTEAKEAHEGLIASEGYQSQHEKLTKPSALATTAVASRPKKSIDGSKVHDGTSPTDNVAVSGGIAAVAPSTTTTAVGGADAAKSKSKSRSRSRKRNSIFGALLGGGGDHGGKKELKKEEKAEEKAEKEGEKAAKPDIVAEESAKTSKPVESAPLDAAAIASRVIAAPVIPADESTATTAEEPKPIVPEETAESKAAEPTATSPIRENPPKPTKRNSIFGFFGKKESAAPGTKDIAPLTPAKDVETTPVSATAPQLDDPVTTASPEVTSASAAAEPATDSPETSAAVSSPTATATTPDGTKDKRRTSFFGTLGTRKEKKPDTPSDSEAVDGEKRTPNKFGSIFRKPSRRLPSGTRAPNNSEVPPPIPDSTGTSAVASRETAVVEDATVAKPSTPAVDEPTITTTTTGPTPVPATA